MTCSYPCQNKTEYGYCKTTGCINPKFDRTRTFTSYDPIEIARQYAPNYDKPEVEVAEVRHGRWEYTDYGGVGNWHCSVCHNIVVGTKGASLQTPYCPHCGAKMDLDKVTE